MVGVMQRRDIPWLTLRAEYEAGATASALERRFSVTRQAIMKRVKKEGWKRTDDAERIAATNTAARLARPVTRADRAVAASGLRSHANAQRLLDMLATGSTRSLAAKRLGMHRDSLADWLKSDPQFAALADAAEAEFAGSMVQNIASAAERDWRAAAHLMDRLPVTRGEYVAASEAIPRGPAIALQLVLGAEAAALMAQRAAPTPPTIEHSPGDSE